MPRRVVFVPEGGFSYYKLTSSHRVKVPSLAFISLLLFFHFLFVGRFSLKRPRFYFAFAFARRVRAALLWSFK